MIWPLREHENLYLSVLALGPSLDDCDVKGEEVTIRTWRISGLQ